jgi:hypothetical protein
VPDNVHTIHAQLIEYLNDDAVSTVLCGRHRLVLHTRAGHISHGRRRVVIRKRDKSRTERVVDLHEPRTLDAVSRYMMHERPLDAPSPFVFLVEATGNDAWNR